MTDYEYYIDKYKDKIELIDKFDCWTMEQLKEFLHIDFDTVQKFVDEGILYKFKVSKVCFYSSHKPYFSNKLIRKSILLIDKKYKMTYVPHEDKEYIKFKIDDSLTLKNVFFEFKLYDCYYYSVILSDGINQNFKRYEKLIEEIYLHNPTEKIHITFVVQDVGRYEQLEKYLESSSILLPHYIVNNIDIHYRYFPRNCYKYLSI